MTTQDWKSKIAAMLAKAHGQGTTVEESRAYEEKAAYLMNKLGIEESEIRLNSKSPEKPIYEEFKKFPPYANSKLELLAIVAQCMGGRLIDFPGTQRMVVFAFAGDLERIKMMYFSLLAQMHIEASVLKVPQAQSKKAYTTSWLRGFAYGVSKRLQRAYRKANEETNALILYDRESKIRDEVLAVFGKTRMSNAPAISDSRGWSDGVKSGLAADVGQDRMGSRAAQRAIGEMS